MVHLTVSYQEFQLIQIWDNINWRMRFFKRKLSSLIQLPKQYLLHLLKHLSKLEIK
jgi:hypothetical protein